MNKLNLDLCCGPRKAEGHYGIDILPFAGVDKVYNLNNGIPLPNDSCVSVRAYDAIEHIKDPIMVMKEIWRVLEDGGSVDILVPSTDGRGAWQDGTHVSFWNENSFRYWINPLPFMDYYRRECLFQLIKLETTPMSIDDVCHVVFRARAVKNAEWISTHRNRFHLVEE